jgi:hypothetical protein
MVQTELPFIPKKLSKTQTMILEVLPKEEGMIAEQVRNVVLSTYPPEEVEGMLVETASRRLRELVNMGYAKAIKTKMVDSEKTYMRWIRL